MLFSGNVEDFFSLFRVPLTHLECESRLSYTGLSREKYETSWRKSASEDIIELTTHTRKLSESTFSRSHYFMSCFRFSDDFLPFSRIIFAFFESIPLTAVRTLSCPLQHIPMTSTTYIHKRLVVSFFGTRTFLWNEGFS